MMDLRCTIEDSVITLTEHPTERNEEGIPVRYDLKINVLDRFSGEERRADVSYVQAAAILALTWAGEDLPEEVTAKLYEIAEPVVQSWPSNVRPIP